MLVKIKEAAKLLGVCEESLRNWDKDGTLIALRTVGGHRRYDMQDLRVFLLNMQDLQSDRIEKKKEKLSHTQDLR